MVCARWMLWLAVLVLAVACCCSSDTRTDAAVPDAAGADTVVDEAGLGDAVGAIDAQAADGARDSGPRPPSHWEPVSSSPDLPQQVDHRAVRLADGRVLISGGTQQLQDSWRYTAQTYLYDPVSDTVVTAGAMITPRSDHSATLLEDGRVLVVGGRTAEMAEKSTELFDPKAPPAIAWSAGPPLFVPRLFHRAVRLTDGRVLVTGGLNAVDSEIDSLDTAALFDPKTGTWSALLNSMNELRRSHTATLLDSGKVLIAGGVRGGALAKDAIYHDSLELFDPVQGTFKLLSAKMSRKRMLHRAVRLDDGRVLIVGGDCTGPDCGTKQAHDIYDPVLGTSTSVAVAGTYPSRRHEVVLLPDGRVLLLHGEDDPGTVLAFDPILASWSAMPDLPTAPIGITATVLEDGSVFVCGGVTDPSTAPPTYADQAFRLYP